jgi:hypothetical protein
VAVSIITKTKSDKIDAQQALDEAIRLASQGLDREWAGPPASIEAWALISIAQSLIDGKKLR